MSEPTALRSAKRNYDPACEDLARGFLADEGDYTDAELHALAQRIQDTIEGYLQYGRKGKATT
jgi:hypothetical protein